jgi:hypothetical protein
LKNEKEKLLNEVQDKKQRILNEEIRRKRIGKNKII